MVSELRLAITLALVGILRVLIDMSAYLLVNIKLFYIVLIGLLSSLWILVDVWDATTLIGISKHLYRTIRHSIVLKWGK